MKRESLCPIRVHSWCAVTVGIAAFLVGCVDLEKPDSVKLCASSREGCSDNPGGGSRDAALDALTAPGDARPSDPPWMSDAVNLGDERAGGLSDIVDGTDERADGLPNAADRVAVPDGSVETALADSPRPDGNPDVELPEVAADLWPPLDLPVSPDMQPDLQPDGPLDLAEVGRDAADVLSYLDSSDDGPPNVDVGPDQNPDTTTNCITPIVDDGYKAGTAPACSECKDSAGGTLASKCTGMLDCLASKGKPALVECLNVVGGSSLVRDCVTALTNAAGCPAAYY